MHQQSGEIVKSEVSNPETNTNNDQPKLMTDSFNIEGSKYTFAHKRTAIRQMGKYYEKMFEKYRKDNGLRFNVTDHGIHDQIEKHVKGYIC